MPRTLEIIIVHASDLSSPKHAQSIYRMSSQKTTRSWLSPSQPFKAMAKAHSDALEGVNSISTPHEASYRKPMVARILHLFLYLYICEFSEFY